MLGNKYFKPKSITWWASFTPFILGVLLALAATFPVLAPLAVFINTLTGGLDAYILINMGLVGIGLRGAIDETRLDT